MAHFTFDIEMVRRDGTSEPAGQIALEDPDYNKLSNLDALSHLTANKEQYGFRIDQENNLVMCGGVVMLFSDFARLQVRLVRKSLD